MPIEIAYKTLFKLDVFHHYFLDGGKTDKAFGDMGQDEKKAQLKLYELNRFLAIKPDPKTRQLMIGHKQLLKETNTGCRIITSATTDNKPVIDIQEKTKWVFGLVLKDPNFWNYTSLRLTPSFDLTNQSRNNVRRLFYYSNNSVGITSPNLSKNIPAHSNTATYQMNDLVIESALLYEAVGNTPNNTTPLQSNNDWQAVNEQQYATHLDEIRWRSTFFNYQFTQPDIWAEIKIVDGDGNEMFKKYAQSSVDKMLHPINMTGQLPGLYELQVRGSAGYTEDQPFYFNPAFEEDNLLGVIEIFKDNTLANDWRILNASGEINNKTFELRYKNRLTKWRYKNGADNTLITGVVGADGALPLTATGFKDSVTKGSKKLPNPDVRMIKTESDAYYSDVFVNAKQYP